MRNYRWALIGATLFGIAGAAFGWITRERTPGETRNQIAAERIWGLGKALTSGGIGAVGGGFLVLVVASTIRPSHPLQSPDTPDA